MRRVAKLIIFIFVMSLGFYFLLSALSPDSAPQNDPSSSTDELSTSDLSYHLPNSANAVL